MTDPVNPFSDPNFGKSAATEPNPFSDPDFGKPAGLLRKIADKGLGFASGAVGATKAIADAAGAGNVVSGALGQANTFINDQLSAQAKADQQEQASIMAAAKDKGLWEGVKAGARAFGVAPLQTSVQGLGSVVPVLAGAAAGLPGAVATGLAMGAGTAKGAIYDEIKRRGGTEEQATQAQAYGGENTDQIALGSVLGAADAATGVSRIAGGMLRGALGRPVVQTAKQGVERGVLGRAGMGMLGEMPLEAAQGGQEQVAANIAAQRAGYQAGTWDNVASNATLEALASAGPGAVFGALETKHGQQPPGSAPTVPPAPPLQIGNTPDQMIGFPDGSVGRRSEVDQYINSLPAEQQASARAKLMGLAPQPAQPPAVPPDVPPSPPAPPSVILPTGHVITQTEAPSLSNAVAAGVRSGAIAGEVLDDRELADLVTTERRDKQVILAQMDQEQKKQAEIDAAFEAKPALDAQQRAATVEAPSAMQLAMQAATKKESQKTGVDRAPAQTADTPIPEPRIIERTPGMPAPIPRELAELQVEMDGGEVVRTQNRNGKYAYHVIKQTPQPPKETPQPPKEEPSTDILNKYGQPFTNLFAAKVNATKAGPGYEAVEIGKNAFVVRKISQPKPTAPGTANAKPELQAQQRAAALDAPSAMQQAMQAAKAKQQAAPQPQPSLALEQETQQPEPPTAPKTPSADILNPQTSEAASLSQNAPATTDSQPPQASTNGIETNQAQQVQQVQPQTPSAKAAAVAPQVTGPAQPTALGTQTNVSAGPGFSAQDVASFRPAQPAPNQPPSLMQAEQGATNAVAVQPNNTPAASDASAPQGVTIDQAAHEAATSPQNDKPQPTDGQKKAGNYSKGHVVLGGLALSIENPAGSVRSGKDKSGKPWSNTLKHHYGYILGTMGNDKDHVDLFVKPNTPLDYSGQVFVIDQVHPETGKFDEHKVMVGFPNILAAKAAYMSNYDKGWKGMKAVTPMAFGDFKTWVKAGPKNTPLAATGEAGVSQEAAALMTQFRERLGALSSRAHQANESKLGARIGGNLVGLKTTSIYFNQKWLDEAVARYEPMVQAAEQKLSGKKASASEPEKPAPKVTAKERERIRRDTEKTVYNDLKQSPDMIGKSVDEIKLALLARAPDSKPETIDKMAADLHKEIQKNQAEIERQKHRDPAVLEEAMSTAMPDGMAPESYPQFQVGFTHALAGKTKSTLAGDGLDSMIKGYEAAQKWIKTPIGHAFYEGVPVNKLQNTGIDLRRHWELMKANMKANETDVQKAWAAIERATSRADFFAPVLVDGIAPGLRLYVTTVRDSMQTFKKWLTDKTYWYGSKSFARKYGKSEKSDIEYMLDGTRYPGDLSEEDRNKWKADSAYRTDYLRNKAEEYLKAVEEHIGFLQGKSSVKEAATAFSDQFLAENPENGLYWKTINLTDKGTRVYRNLFDGTRNEFQNLRSASDWTKALIEKEATIALPNRATPLTPPKLDRVTRSGLPDHRSGKDVTPEQFKTTFGFADVGFGTWVGAKQDQDHLNYAFDAFSDLAKHFGIAPKKVGLGIHFTIGALGHGKYSAHFSPKHPGPTGDVQVINLTNTRGDGAVYHEWVHALDHNLGGQWQSSVRGAVLEALTRQQLTIEALESRAKQFLFNGSYWKSNKNMDKVQAAIKGIYYFKPHATVYKQNADALGKDYWGNDEELIARAAEAWAADTLGGDHSYLVNAQWVGDGNVTAAKGYRGTPYPTGDERKHFNNVFTALSKAVTFNDNGKPVVTLADFERELNTLNSDIATVQAYKKKLQTTEGMTELRDRVIAAKEEEQQAKIDEQERLASEKLAELDAKIESTSPPVIDPPKPDTTQGPLTDDDLSALFDQAAAELRESQQEQPNEPAPSEQQADPGPSFDKWTIAELQELSQKSHNSDLIALGGGGGIPNVLTIHDLAKLGHTEHRGFGMFETKGVDDNGKPWTINWDGGGEMRRLASGKPYTNVSLQGPGVAPFPSGIKRAIEAEIDRLASLNRKPQNLKDGIALNQEKKAEQKKQDKADPKATALIAQAAKLGVTGISEALTGLSKLFGSAPGRLNSFPAGFDEETYAQAKPHFQKSLEAFQKAGKTLKDLFMFLIQNFGEGIKMYAIQFAKDQALTNTLGESSKTSPSSELAGWVQGKIASGTEFKWQELFDRADQAWGGTQAQGKYTPKDAYDAMEMGMNRYILANPTAFNPSTQNEVLSTVSRLQRLTQLLTTQTKRTEEMDEFQQFSTVPAFAFVANWVAGVRSTDVMMEPSAGIGGLAVFSKNAGAQLVLNELSSRRAAVLQEVFPSARVFHENAEQINNILPPEIRPTVVVMNPPFSASAGRMGSERDTKIGAKHVEQALERLADGGRLVAIVGEGMAADRQAFKAWWKRTGAKYDVRAIIPVDGKGYAKYGTTFDNALLVIDKVKPSGRAIVTTPANTYEDLIGILSEIRNDRPATVQHPDTSAQRDGAESARQDPDETGGSSDQPGQHDSGGIPELGDRNPLSRPNSGRSGVRSGRGGSATKAGSGVPEPDGRPQADAGADTGGSSLSDGRNNDSDVSGVNLTSNVTAAAELTDSVFENYQPQRLQIKGSKPHPGALVQSAAMASVLPPAATYVPNLPSETITDGKLSLAQIEAVVYAGQAHQEFLDEKVHPNVVKKHNVKADQQYRKGFFIGDGTGLGKGREIGGIILDNLRQGRKKAIWISEKQGLIHDAKRDFAGVGGDEKLIFNLSDGAKDREEGVMFTTYSTLRVGANDQSSINKKGWKKVGDQLVKIENGKPDAISRIQEIINWVGPDYDGVIAFDESHNGGNAVSIKGDRGNSDPSKQAMAMLELQARLPKARVLYVSATGATTVENLAYAARLGLWGAGTPFPNVQSFVSEMQAGGLATMELVARDMKQMGVYMARSLSFDGVTYGRIDHELSDLQTDAYNVMAKAWQLTLKNIDAALEETGAVEARPDGGRPVTRNSEAKRNAITAYWGAQLRFFNQIITSMQMPSVLEQMERDIAAGHALVLQLVNTNEAQQNRAMNERVDGDADASLEDLDLTPKAQLLAMIDKSFPTAQMEEFIDENGNKKSHVAKDSEGNPVQNAKAVAMKKKLMDDIDNIHVFPDGPLEIVLNHFGVETVAEVTGRSQRIVRKKDKDGVTRAKLEKRGSGANRADAEAFMANKKRILIFSDAGGTGFSFHADKTKDNQRKRSHYLIQPGWRADKAVQGFGRSHRTNQKSAPHYWLASTSVPAHKRFLSAIARRLDMLGAMTKGQRDTANQGMFSEKDNLDSKYAQQAVAQLFRDALVGQLSGLTFDELMDQTGMADLIDPNTGQIAESRIPKTSQFLNRMLSMPLDVQEKVFSAFVGRMEEKIDVAIQRGELDAGLETIKAISTKVVSEDVVFTEPKSGANTKLISLELTLPTTMYALPKESTQGGRIEWVKNVKSGRVWGKVLSGTTTLKNGATVPRYRMLGTSGTQIITQVNLKTQDGKDAYAKIDAEQAKALWDQETQARPKTHTKTQHMIVGALLPIWDRLKTDGSVLRVMRTQTEDNQRLLGRVVEEKDIADIRKRLNVASPAARMTPLEVMRRLIKGDIGELANGWKLNPVTVSGDLRIEIVGSLVGRADTELKGIGVIRERIQWADRYFVPVGADGVPVLTQLLKSKPLVDLLDLKDKSSSPSSDDTAALSRTTTTAINTPLSAVRQAIDKAYGKLLERLEAKGLVQLHQTQDDALQAAAQARSEVSGQSVQSERAKLLGTFDVKRSSDGSIQGFFDPLSKKAFLVADGLTVQSAPGVLMHEVGIHMAADGSMKGLFNRAKAMTVLGKGKPFFDEVAQRMMAAGVSSSEEYAAYITELYERDRSNAPSAVKQWFKDLTAAVRAWLFRHGALVKAQDLTAADIAAVARANARSMASGAAGTWRVQFSRATSSISDRLRAFMKGSKIVNADGTPKIMYHGTARDITKFAPKQADAIFLTDNPDFAADFAGMSEWWMVRHAKEVLPADVIAKIEQAADKAKAAAKAGDEGRSYNKAYREGVLDNLPTGQNIMPLIVNAQNPFDYENKAHVDVLRKAGVPRVADIAEGDWKAIESPEVQAAIKAADFDGFYVMENGVRNLAVYKSEQVKSVTGNIGTYNRTNPDVRYSFAGQRAPEVRNAEGKLLAPNGEVSKLTEGQWHQVRSPQFKEWFGDWENDQENASKVVDANGEPMVFYHGTDADFDKFDLKRGGSGTLAKDANGAAFFTSSATVADDFSGYLYVRQGDDVVQHFTQGANTMPVFVRIVDPTVWQMSGNAYSQNFMTSALKEARKDKSDGVVFTNMRDGSVSTIGPWKKSHVIVTFKTTQVKSATGNVGAYGQRPITATEAANMGMTQAQANKAQKAGDIRFSIAGQLNTLNEAITKATVTDLKHKFGNRLADFRGLGLQTLGRRQLVDLYASDLPQLDGYNDMVAQMDADKNESAVQADALATAWGKLKDERQLAELMHDATLAQIDPDKALVAGDDENFYAALKDGFDKLTPQAQATYRQARDMYSEHNDKVRAEIRARIERSELSSAKKQALLEKMDGEFFKKVKGVYFPLARFGQYVTIVRDSRGEVASINRSETMNEAEATRKALLAQFPAAGGWTVGKVLKDKEFNAARDGVGRGFMADLFETLEKTHAGAELIDSISQLYLAALPDLSWAKHGIHRKGTPGFSQDARRAFAQNMFHGARYLARLRYADRLQGTLDNMQQHVDGKTDDAAYDSVKAQQVIDEMVKRYDSMMNPQTNPLSTALTSFGFVFHLGLSPASALVNLSQTALVAYPLMGAKWGFGKASAALLDASKQAAANKNDISKVLRGDELKAYASAVNAGVIDVTMAHDLASIASGEDSKMSAKLRPIMKASSFLFHHAEKFNRQVTFVAAYRLARQAGAEHQAAYAQAVKATYDGHFDYSQSNRARVMQGNVARVVLLFKQYAQNMIYTLARQAQLSLVGATAQERAQARKALSGLLVSHAMAAGVFGLPAVGLLLSAASAIGSDDDEPWDAKVALQNMLAETFGSKPAEVFVHGLSRLGPWDISGRVGLDTLLLPDVQEGLQQADTVKAWMAGLLGPVAGVAVNAGKGMQDIANGQWERGLESMLPSALRAPLKAWRYGTEGNIDKSGVVINDEISAAGVAGQALGFSPSQARLAQEGKSAIHSADRAVQERRTKLVHQFAMAAMAGDKEGKADAREAIARFNEKNPHDRVTTINLMQSVLERHKRIAQAQQGVYLPKRRQEARQAGRFAVAE